MKLTRHITKKDKEKKWYRNDIHIPQEAIDQLGWGHGQELKWTINKDKKLVIEKT